MFSRLFKPMLCWNSKHICCFDLSSPKAILMILTHWNRALKQLHIPLVIKQNIERYVLQHNLIRLNAAAVLQYGFKYHELANREKLHLFKSLSVTVFGDWFHEFKKQYIHTLLPDQQSHKALLKLTASDKDVQYVVHNSSTLEDPASKLMVKLKVRHGTHDTLSFDESCLIIFVLDRADFEESFFEIKRKLDEMITWRSINDNFLYIRNDKRTLLMVEPSENEAIWGQSYPEEFIQLFCMEHDLEYGGFVDFHDALAINQLVEKYVWRYLKRITSQCGDCGQMFVKSKNS